MAIVEKKSNFRRRREEMLMSRADLAHKSGVSIQTIVRIERGKPCRAQTRHKLLLALNLSIADDEWVFGANLR